MPFHYQIKFLDKSKESPNSEELRIVNKQTESLKFNRGNILDYIIEIELIINILIENAMIHKKSKLWKVFRANILNNKSVTFKHKIDLLCAIIKEKKELDGVNLSVLEKSLNSLREERNKWAHGVIHFKEEKENKKLYLEPYLNWINSNGKENEICVGGSYFSNLTDELEASRRILVELLKKRKILSKNFPQI
ncbi:hypothetical protein HY450_02610 [Candidatus Pacearchaeota archaeon]|nr:hypothetical protein [Candidatus Pacearchaeota archaeon]